MSKLSRGLSSYAELTAEESSRLNKILAHYSFWATEEAQKNLINPLPAYLQDITFLLDLLGFTKEDLAYIREHEEILTWLKSESTYPVIAPSSGS